MGVQVGGYREEGREGGRMGWTYRDARSDSLFVQDIVCSELDGTGVER